MYVNERSVEICSIAVKYFDIITISGLGWLVHFYHCIHFDFVVHELRSTII